jgi:MinD-like ATPase involved in chromosome partitioning or flagellar assembly
MSKIIAIHSYRGGTGKSNITANLAVAIALQGKRVALVDTDLQSPGIHTIFSSTIATKTLNDYLWNRCAIQDAVYDVSDDLEIDHKGRVFLLPSSVNVNEIARIISEGYNVNLLNSGFQRLIKELELDYLFIDTHPGLSRETLLSIAISNLLIIILRPDRQDFQGTAVTVDIARQLKVSKIMIVINKVLSQMNFSELQEKVETTYGISVAGILPVSAEMMQLGSSGVFCLRYPHYPFTQILNQVAVKVMSDSL